VSVSRRSKRRSRVLSAGLVLAAAALPLAGCKEVETETATGYEPAHIEEIKGSGDLKRVTFTPEGAKRTGVKTEKVRDAGDHRVAPYAALIYDPEGRTYVYATHKPLEYVREKIAVDRVDGDRVIFRKGPRAGTELVTVGAAEVYGTELEVAGSH
jgi:hypothetical protein